MLMLAPMLLFIAQYIFAVAVSSRAWGFGAALFALVVLIWTSVPLVFCAYGLTGKQLIKQHPLFAGLLMLFFGVFPLLIGTAELWPLLLIAAGAFTVGRRPDVPARAK